MDGAASRSCRRIIARGAARDSLRRLERRAGGSGRLLGSGYPARRGDAAGSAPAVAANRPSGLDRRTARISPDRREALHLLGLYRRLLAARFGLPARSPALLA